MTKSFLALALLLAALTASAQSRADEEKAIAAACYDYIDAFYRADTTLAYRSVHPLLQKRGFAWSTKSGTYSKQLEMPFPALVKLARTWNASGRSANADSPREVKVLDVEDKTATAKVTAVWGIDYIHLVRENNRWMILNVLWQSLPPRKG